MSTSIEELVGRQNEQPARTATGARDVIDIEKGIGLVEQNIECCDLRRWFTTVVDAGLREHVGALKDLRRLLGGQRPTEKLTGLIVPDGRRWWRSVLAGAADKIRWGWHLLDGPA